MNILFIFILNVSRERFSQQSGILSFRIQSLFDIVFIPSLSLFHFVVLNLVCLDMKIIFWFSRSHSVTGMEQLKILNNWSESLYSISFSGVALFAIACKSSNETYQSQFFKQTLRALAEAESIAFLRGCFRLLIYQTSELQNNMEQKFEVTSCISSFSTPIFLKYGNFIVGFRFLKGL